MRTVYLERTIDVSGISGTGKVAEGVEFADGTVALRWLSANASTVVYEKGLDAVRAVHGHNGATAVVFTGAA
jgi:hypothetical protein